MEFAEESSDRRKGVIKCGFCFASHFISDFLFPHSIMIFSFSSHVWVTFPPNPTPTPGACFLVVSPLTGISVIKPHPPLGFSPGSFHLSAEAQLSWSAIRWSPAASSLLQALSAGKNCVLTGREETIARHAQVQYLASLGNTELLHPGRQPTYFSWKAVGNPFSAVAITSKRRQHHNSNNPENF